MHTPTRFIAKELAAWAERNPRAAYQLFAAVGYQEPDEPVVVTLELGPDECTLDEVLEMPSTDDARLVLLFDHAQQAIFRKAADKFVSTF